MALHGEQAIGVLQRSEKSTLSELLARSRQTFTGQLDYLTRATDMQAELVTRALVELKKETKQKQSEKPKPAE